ncbi:MAG: CotH kinase family protein, partial [Eubacteriales bacterium]|nr:CotH kinase family protein [Eubacteriales bacterium]
MHGRGNSSWKEDKKQYSLNLASERSILGMNNARKFALIANTSDPSFLRNKTTYDLAVLTGMPASPQCVFVNVYFNGEYHGLYLMAQRPNAKDGSVHIADLEKKNLLAAGLDPDALQAGADSSDPEASVPKAEADASGSEGGVSRPEADTSDTQSGQEPVETVTLVNEQGLEIHASPREEVPDNISGGYLLEIDGRYEEENYWFSTKTHHFVVKYPEAVPLRECEYIAGYLREAETALYSDDGINPDTGKSWEDYFDIKSWASMYLMQDFMTQWDVESFSFFLYKDADDPHLYCGPVWDFDLSMGATGLGKLPDVMRLSIWLREHRQGWLTELEKFPAFTKTLESFAGKRFFPLLTEYLSEDTNLTIPGFRDYMKTLGSSVRMDAHRWGEPDQFEEESGKLLSWIQKRADFWQGYAEDPAAYCRVTLRYGFRDMDIYIPRGKAIGFVPTEEYGEYFYSSFRKKYGSIDGWHCEDGSLLTPDTVIDRDQVMTPFS